MSALPTVRGTIRAIRVLWQVARWEAYTADMAIETTTDPATGDVGVCIGVRRISGSLWITPSFPLDCVFDALDHVANEVGEAAWEADRIAPTRVGYHPCGHRLPVGPRIGTRVVRVDRP